MAKSRNRKTSIAEPTARDDDLRRSWSAWLMVFVIGAIAAAIVGLTALAYYTNATSRTVPVQNETTAQKATPVKAPSADRSILVRWHSPSFGNKSAGVTVVEWFDPECEGCRAVHPAFEKIMFDYSDRVHFVLRYMPFHKNSLYAASVLEEARELGKFKEALTILFQRQPEWARHGAPRPDLIPAFLEKLGIPKEKLERTYVIQKHAAKIKLDEEDGLKVGVRATPTFFVNGEILSELGEEQLRAAINKALTQTK